MVSSFYGRPVRTAQVAALLHGDRDGVTFHQLLTAAERIGLSGSGFRVSVAACRGLARGAILHWAGNHFVVLDRFTRRGVWLVDPAVGRVFHRANEFAARYSGTALVLTPVGDRQFGPAPPSPALVVLRDTWMRARLLTQLLLLTLGSRLLPLAAAAISATVIDYVTAGTGSDRFSTATLAASVGVVGLLVGILTWIRSCLLNSARADLDVALLERFADSVLGAPLAQVRLRTSGEFIARSRSITAVRDVLSTASVGTIIDSSFLVAFVTLLVVVAPTVGAVATGLVLLHLTLVACVRLRLRQRTAEFLLAQSDTQSVLYQLLSGLESIKAAAGAAFARDWYRRHVRAERDALVSRGRVTAAIDGLNAVTRTAGPTLVFLTAGERMLAGHLSPAMAVFVFVLANGIFTPLTSMVSTVVSLHSVGNHLDRIDAVLELDTEPERTDRDPISLLAPAIETRSLSFGYSDAAPLVLEEVSLTIPSGAKVAITGQSGVGKSTLARLLIGLEKPTSGTVLLGGRPPSDPANPYPGSAGIVMQTPYLFSLTLRENLAFGCPDADVARLGEVIREVCLDEDIARMPLGWRTPVGQGGAAVSAGQAQRIALGRALLRRPPLLLLDEATGNLDSELEQRILGGILASRATTLIVTHRPTVAERCDMVLKIARGRVEVLGRQQSGEAASRHAQ
jgi:ABC-type bacteriocin/lantibiotic exporter with double-glycine peptidase domain